MTEERMTVARPPGPGDDPGHALEQAIALNVRALRVARRLSITELAEVAGISKAMLSKVENAQTSCSLATLARLAAGLEVPASTLLESLSAEDQAERGELISLLGDVIRRLGGTTAT